MNKLEKIEIMAKDLMTHYCPDYTFQWDRSVRRKGQCRYGSKQIGLSKPLAELNTIECMLLTVTHEIAHVLTAGDGHGEEWKRVCLEIGGDGRIYYDVNETKRPAKWILYHDGIKTSISRFRRFATNESGLHKYEWRKDNG